MLKTKIFFALILLIGISSLSFIFISSNGIAGYTGSPGEVTCSNCHGGGTSPASSISISATPSFSNNEYQPGTTYTIDLTVAASGFSRFGFGCEILTSTNTNAGLMQNPKTGVKFLNSGQRRNAVHTTPKINTGFATFSFEWVAPQSGAATIYASGNAVNGNNSTSGDFPITPVSLALQAAQPIDPVNLSENQILAEEVLIYPVPAKDLATISYQLKQDCQVELSICNIEGKELKNFDLGNLSQGSHAKILNMEAFERGLYFVRLYGNGKRICQKMLVLN